MKIATLKIAFFLLAISFTNCSKEEDPVPPLQQLPPMTQVGANTVGCLVNGEVFLPKGSNPTGSPIVTCYYQFVDGAYEFGLGFSNNQTRPLRSIHILSNKLKFIEGQTYQLKAEKPEKSTFANYLLGGGLFGGYITNNTIKGELKINKLTPEKGIISGTFWFDAVNTNDEKIEIRNGRFDMQYSQ